MKNWICHGKNYEIYVIIIIIIIIIWGSWLSHYGTSQKVAGSIPDGLIRFFHLLNPAGRIMALGSTQSLIEISTRNISWG